MANINFGTELSMSEKNKSMSKENAFSRLAYQLIYPGVLGSMLFDLADPFRDPSLIWLCTLLIALCFIVDYLHLTLNLLPEGSAPHSFQPFMDIIIALLFCVSYFAIARAATPDVNSPPQTLNVIIALFLLMIAHALIIIYDLLVDQIKGFIDFVPLICSTTGVVLIISISTPKTLFWLTSIILGVILITYIIRIINIDLRLKKSLGNKS